MARDEAYLPMIIYGEGEFLDMSPRVMFVDDFSERLEGLLASVEEVFNRRVSERRVSPAIAKRWFAETEAMLQRLRGLSQEDNVWGEIGDFVVRLYTLSFVISEGVLSSDIDLVDLLLSADELRVKRALQEQRWSLPVVSTGPGVLREGTRGTVKVPR